MVSWNNFSNLISFLKTFWWFVQPNAWVFLRLLYIFFFKSESSLKPWINFCPGDFSRIFPSWKLFIVRTSSKQRGRPKQKCSSTYLGVSEKLWSRCMYIYIYTQETTVLLSNFITGVRVKKIIWPWYDDTMVDTPLKSNNTRLKCNGPQEEAAWSPNVYGSVQEEIPIFEHLRLKTHPLQVPFNIQPLGGMSTILQFP